MWTQETDTSDEQLSILLLLCQVCACKEIWKILLLSAYQSMHILFFSSPNPPPPLHQRNLESERNIYPPPPHGGSSEYIPRSFHFHTCSQLGRKYSYQQAQHSVSSVIYYQWYESLQREGRKIALSILQHMGSDSLTLWTTFALPYLVRIWSKSQHPDKAIILISLIQNFIKWLCNIEH